MDFSSMRAYLDASNWQQTPPPPPQNHHGGIIINPSNPNPLLPPPPLPPLQHQTHPPAHAASMGPGGSIRPGSMAERARMANIPMPVTAVKCPRCDSTNTKFCYYNNYSLSQPRHFCKTCRRYWTNGGALRNVPVGGGCRRNKRSKSSSSASSSKSTGNHRSTSSAATATSSANSAPPSSVADILGLTPPPPLRFMSPLHHQLGDFIASGELGLSSYGGVSGTGGAEFHLGSGSGVAEQWRAPPPPQFPFLGGLDAAAGGSLYGHPFELPNLGIGQSLRPKPSETGAVGDAAAAPPVKPEENGRDMSLMRQFMQQGNGGAGEQYSWGGGGGGNNGWNEISGLNNSSCSNTSGV